MSDSIKELCFKIPKAELHLHIEGTLEPELYFNLAKKHGITLESKSLEELKKKYQFKDLQDFLNLYYEACQVLIEKEDFAELSYAFGKKAYSQGLKYAEIFFDPQSHLKKISLENLILGIREGLDKIKKEHQDFDYNLIMCFLRDLPEEDALKILEDALPLKKYFFGIGLDSAEVGNPPEKFKNVYAKAKAEGLHLVAHGGEEGPIEYISKAIDILGVERIDHGYRINEDKENELSKRVADAKIPFTLCPISNQKLKVCPDITKYKIRDIINKGVLVMVNSDDPAYFGGYIGDNYYALVENLAFTKEEIIQLAKNSFISTFLPEKEKEKYIRMIDEFVQ